MSEVILPPFEGMHDEPVVLTDGADDFDLVAVAGGETELSVSAGIASTISESPEVDGDRELGTTVSPVVCEGLGRAACVGCPLFQQCLERQQMKTATDKQESKTYLEELLDEEGPAIVIARPILKEQPQPPTQKQPDVPPRAASTEKLPIPVEELVTSPEAVTPMVETEPVVKNEIIPPAVETPALQPPSAPIEVKSVPTEERVSIASREYSRPQPIMTETVAAATSAEEKHIVEASVTSQLTAVGLAATPPTPELIVPEAEAIIPSPAPAAVVPAEPTPSEAMSRSEKPRAVETAFNERASDDEPQPVSLVETGVATVPLVAVSMATEQDLLLQLPVDDGVIKRLPSWGVEEADESGHMLYPSASLVSNDVVAVSGDEQKQTQHQIEHDGLKRLDIFTTHDGVASAPIMLHQRSDTDMVASEAAGLSMYPQERAKNSPNEQPSMISGATVVEENGTERVEGVSEVCYGEVGVTVAVASPDVVVKTTIEYELVNSEAISCEDGVPSCGNLAVDNCPETEAPAPSDDTPQWSTILGMVAVFVTLQRHQGAVY